MMKSEDVIRSEEHSDCRPRRRRRAAISTTTMVALLFAHGITPGDCFGAVTMTTTTTKTPEPQQPQHYRGASSLHYAPSAQSYNIYNLWQPPSGPSSRSANNNNKNVHLEPLTQYLLEKSLFTHAETVQLTQTIEHVSGANPTLHQETAKFCLLLAETMELGLHALMAAAVHYTSFSSSSSSGSSSSPSSTLPPPTLVPHLNPHVMAIAKNADTLQYLEQHNAAIRTPNDAQHVRHLLLTETVDWRALAIRAGAVLYQMKHPAAARIALRIYAPLSSRLGMHKLKNELEESAFRMLYPRSYQRVRPSDPLETTFMRQVLDRTKQDITHTLSMDDEFMRQVEDFSVMARVKEPYSLWKKMLSHKYDHFLQVPDALALRVILKAKKETIDEPVELTRGRERALCYYVQELLRQRYHPVEGNPRFKDYIQSPKFNGYQSLHYTATTMDHGGTRWTCEIQIRSHEMHQIAEFGLASHAEYKEEGTSSVPPPGGQGTHSNTDPSVEAYLKNLQAWHWQHHADTMIVDSLESSVVRLSDPQSRERADRIRERTARLQPYLDALTFTKSDLVHKQVVVFLNTGASSTVVSLPAGACVLDALRQRSSAYFNSNNAKVNGQVIPITRQLHNGDVLELSKITA
jgi:ppGpp synthetase/RelA/SpoT-type nucleotidyltranferase